ncbi:MAG: NADH-quinone oxidoreductase subunit NuoF [Pseudomonadota bacterium]
MAHIKDLKTLQQLREKLEAEEQGVICVTVCGVPGCGAGSGQKMCDAFLEAIHAHEDEKKIVVKKTGCQGFCEKGPIVTIRPQNIFYHSVTLEDIPEIVESTLLNNKVVERLLYTDPATGKICASLDEVPFYAKQVKVVLQNCGRIDPNNIKDYIRVGGYEASGQVLSGWSPQQVIDCVKESGLRGRGGAGFPAGRKWESSQKAHGEQKYIICNGDEGDPGAFMDRSVMEGDPHSVLEGMIIAGYAVGATKGIIYVRSEYPLAVRHLTTAIAQANDLGLLGQNLFGSGFDFEIDIVKGAGAFVCGESTALVMSIEGKRGFPKPIPRANTSISGLWGMPTVLNNVETLACVAPIILKGGKWFSSMGTDKSKGTKVFALSGNIMNTGLVEVPMGTTLREIVFDIGGGVRGGRKFKAIQTGGPSGGCIPEHLLDLPVDYESLAKAGSIMGSGGMLVMDEKTCMVNMAKYFLNFAQNESCGQCTLCKLGTKQMFDILNDITRGKGRPGDLDVLLEISEALIEGSLCGLGQSAPNSVVSTIRYFREEYEEHIHEKKCRALVCTDLIHYRIREYKCKACTLCAKSCPVDAIIGARWQVHEIDQSKCIRCGTCMEVCPPKFKAIECVSGKATE